MNKSMKKNIEHFFLLTAFATATIHLANRFINITAEMKNILKTESGNFYNWKNGRIYYTKRGTGSPVLLIHELSPSSSSYEWSRFSRKLEKTHTVYALDLLGCGRSDKPNLTYTNYLYVQLITDFTKNIICEKTDVITTGNSISFTALANHMNHDLFNKMIAINPSMPVSFNKKSGKYGTWKKTMLELPVVGTFIYNLKVQKKMIQKKFLEDYFARPQLISSEMTDAYYESAHLKHSHGKYLLASLENGYVDNSISHILKDLNNPLYLIVCKKTENSLAVRNAYTKLNHSIETIYLANARLLPQLEEPDKLYESISTLLQKNKAAVV